ncbi:MAG TPA: cupin domain-containing protein [Ktedonobacterales bacterium]|nr:cupin domain-containing protein [Ktedonobacterales bacterium]
MTYTILNKDDLPRAVCTNSATLEGNRYGGTNVSFFWVELAPGDGPRLHRHPCEEVLIVVDGCGTFVLGSETLEAMAGQIVIVPPDMPHKFTNSGMGVLKQIDIPPSKQIVTEWLED